MFHDNITLQKIVWRLENKKANILNKLVTRNNEIKKRQDKGEDFNAFLPDHMKSGAPKAAEPAAAAEGYGAGGAAPVTKRTSVTDMETHIAAVEADHGAELSGDAPAEEAKTEEEAAAP